MGYLVACCNRGGCLKSVSHKNPGTLPGNDLYQVLGARHFTPPSCCSKELSGVKDATTLRVSMGGNVCKTRTKIIKSSFWLHKGPPKKSGHISQSVV